MDLRTLDYMITNRIRQCSNKTLTFAANILSWTPHFILFPTTVYLLYQTNDLLHAMASTIFILICILVTEFIIKKYFKRHRPLKSKRNTKLFYEGFSFPSTHTTSTMLLSLVIIYIYPQAFMVIILPFIIGWSRIVLGVHYLADTIGGYLFGIMWYILWIAIQKIN